MVFYIVRCFQNSSEENFLTFYKKDAYNGYFNQQYARFR